jgi:hypothetical protein
MGLFNSGNASSLSIFSFLFLFLITLYLGPVSFLGVAFAVLGIAFLTQISLRSSKH